jgi:hypothetical protein
MVAMKAHAAKAQTRKEPWFDVAFILIVVAHAVIPGD